MHALAELLESWWLAQALRRSVWVYPLVNTGHLLGLSLLIGAIVPMDLRLLGLWRNRIQASALAGVLVPVAGCGLVLAIVTGALLFVTRAVDYVNSSLFLAKLLIVGLALTNLVLLHRHEAWARVRQGKLVTRRVAMAAVISLACWGAVLTLGRLVGYR